MPKYHHVHKIHKKQPKDPYDLLVYAFTVITPLFELPQAIEIYQSKSAANVSELTWLFFVISDLVWLGYAIRHNILPLAVMYIIYLIVESFIVIGILIYS